MLNEARSVINRITTEETNRKNFHNTINSLMQEEIDDMFERKHNPMRNSKFPARNTQKKATKTSSYKNLFEDTVVDNDAITQLQVDTQYVDDKELDNPVEADTDNRLSKDEQYSDDFDNYPDNDFNIDSLLNKDEQYSDDTDEPVDVESYSVEESVRPKKKTRYKYSNLFEDGDVININTGDGVNEPELSNDADVESEDEEEEIESEPSEEDVASENFFWWSEEDDSALADMDEDDLEDDEDDTFEGEIAEGDIDVIDDDEEDDDDDEDEEESDEEESDEEDEPLEENFFWWLEEEDMEDAVEDDEESVGGDHEGDHSDDSDESIVNVDTGDGDDTVNIDATADETTEDDVKTESSKRRYRNLF